jgi:hypothetical protein
MLSWWRYIGKRFHCVYFLISFECLLFLFDLYFFAPLYYVLTEVGAARGMFGMGVVKKMGKWYCFLAIVLPLTRSNKKDWSQKKAFFLSLR